MSGILEDKVRIEGYVLGVCENGEWVDVLLGEREMDALYWICNYGSDTVFVRSTAEWEIFFGPYINEQETGYIFQLINRISRRVVTAAVPFNGSVDVKEIKHELSSMLRKGEIKNNEEKEIEKDIH